MDDAAIIREVTDLAILRLTAEVEQHPELAARIEQALGFALPATGRPSGDDVIAIWQGPGDFLIVGPTEAMAGMSDKLAEATAGFSALVGDTASGLAVFDLSGPAAEERLPEWMLGAPGVRISIVRKLAGLRVTVLAKCGSQAGIRLFVDRSYTDYMRQWLEETLR
jgi:sarcosine oxidase subunit gamma